jgi:hypothetical protein
MRWSFAEGEWEDIGVSKNEEHRRKDDCIPSCVDVYSTSPPV